jgi:pimeloyl-ACP methyl ester carboxylesterase
MYSPARPILTLSVTFEPVLDVTPKGYRGISLSMRGYKGSTPLTNEEATCKVPPSQLHRTHISDFVAFIEFVGKKLGVPKRSSDGTGGITTVHWSKGCAVATGLFYFMKENPTYKKVIDEYISSVVLYEPPTSAVFGMDPGDCANKLFYHQLANPPEDPAFMFAKYVTGFFHNSPEYLKNKGGQQVVDYYRSGALEGEFQSYSKKVYEGEYLESILHWFLVDTEEERREACHDSFKAMVQSSLKQVGILYGADGPPECCEGSWLAEKWLTEEGAKAGRDKVTIKQFPGGNHYIQFYDPPGFWSSVLELSV